MTTPFSTLRCIHCHRPLWDGGHALNKDECSEQGGEVCLLHKEIHRLCESLFGSSEVEAGRTEMNVAEAEKLFNILLRVKDTETTVNDATHEVIAMLDDRAKDVRDRAVAKLTALQDKYIEQSQEEYVRHGRSANTMEISRIGDGVGKAIDAVRDIPLSKEG